MNKKVLLAALAAASAGLLFAQEFRIDAGGPDPKGISLAIGIPVEGVSASQATWQKENSDKRLLFIGKISGEWQKRSISFIPKSAGAVNLWFMSTGKEGKYAAYRNLEIKGAELKNKDFSIRKNSGALVGWQPFGKPVVENGVIYCRDSDRFMQTILCKEGDEVTLSFEVRSANAPAK